jgi:hypothetical protein
LLVAQAAGFPAAVRDFPLSWARLAGQG